MIDLDVTIITPTRRYGGLNTLISSLEKQDMPRSRWEAIIVDDTPDPVWLERHALIEKHRADMNMLHIRSDVGPYWRSNRLIAHARNAALVRARGELIIFVDDYSGFKEYFLEEHYDTYTETPWCSLGPVVAVPWTDPPPDDLSTLEPVTVDNRMFQEMSGGPNDIIRGMQWKEGAQDHRSQMYGEQRSCPPGWFFCSNASAPLEKIVECNGQWMLADCTSEEDVMLGLMLNDKGIKFWFKSYPDISVWHMQHGAPSIQPPQLYDEKDLFRVTAQMFNTEDEGSWGLREYMERVKMDRFNQEPECNGWSLAEEREKWFSESR